MSKDNTKKPAAKEESLGAFFANVKGAAKKARESRNCQPGVHLCRMASAEFDNAQSGARMAVIVWQVVKTWVGDDSKGKTIKKRYVLEGRGAEWGRADFAKDLDEVVTPLDYDVEAYQSEEDFEELFAELLGEQILRILEVKPDKNPQYIKSWISTKHEAENPEWLKVGKKKRKLKVEEPEEDESEEDDAEEAEAPPAPKRKSRKKATPVEEPEDGDEDDEEEEEEAPPAKKRKPRKKAAAPAPAVDEDDEDEDEEDDDEDPFA